MNKLSVVILLCALVLQQSGAVLGGRVEVDEAYLERLQQRAFAAEGELERLLRVSALKEQGPVNVLCSYTCGKLCLGKGESCFDLCYDPCTAPQPPYPLNTVGAGGTALGSFIRRDAIQHVGVTCSNLTRSREWYTEVLGGVLVPDAGGPDWKGDDVYNLLTQKEQLDAARSGETAQQEEIPQLQQNGSDVLAAVYVNFGALQVELLDYRARPGKEQQSKLPYYHHSSSPAVVTNMHISFYLNEQADLNEFVLHLERESAKRGFDQVRCNRLVHVNSEAEREAVGLLRKYNSFLQTSGPFQGWALAYCKGPDGEQLEFNQATGKALADFDAALAEYLKSK
mmetsp:Transcript_28373/g.71245  ORF Transcript_28373/g.71245 Transcript_28373/m.71245 type:complete len:340 (+) Transcript_28373:125-1144(+)